MLKGIRGGNRMKKSLIYENLPAEVQETMEREIFNQGTDWQIAYIEKVEGEWGYYGFYLYSCGNVMFTLVVAKDPVLFSETTAALNQEQITMLQKCLDVDGKFEHTAGRRYTPGDYYD